MDVIFKLSYGIMQTLPASFGHSVGGEGVLSGPVVERISLVTDVAEPVGEQSRFISQGTHSLQARVNSIYYSHTVIIKSPATDG